MSLAPQIQAFVRSFSTVPPSQRVLVRLLQVLADNGLDLQDVAATVKLDPGLTSSVMRLSNSAYFGRAHSAETIEEAVTHLGTAELVKVVALVALQDLNADQSTWEGLTQKEAWMLSLATALAMEKWADRGGVEPAEGYTIGLLHGLGHWMIARWHAVQGNSTVKPPRDLFSLASWQEENLGLTYAEVGGLMLERWGFTDELSMPVRYQLEPFAAERAMRAACLLRAVLPLTVALAQPSLYPEALPEMPVKACDVVGLDHATLARQRPVLAEELARIDAVLG